VSRPARRSAGGAGSALLAVIAALALTLSPGPASADAADERAAQRLIDDYIAGWRAFWPTRAFAYGDADSAPRFESFDSARVSRWLKLNARTLSSAQALHDGGDLSPALRADLAVLMAQSLEAQARWAEDRPLQGQPQWYAEQVSQALTHLLVRDQLSAQARSDAAIARLQGVAALCRQARESLRGGQLQRTQRALRTLAGTRSFYRDALPGIVAGWPAEAAVNAAALDAAEAIAALETHIEEHVLPGARAEVSIGSDVYRSKLMRRTAGLYDPERLLAAATREISTVQQLMVAESERWRAGLGDDAPPAEGRALLEQAIAAMESDRQHNSDDFLDSFRTLTFAAERFVEANGIATVPKPTTLIVALSPAHFSGAAVGGVYPSGPFDPRADTLFYVPSIPDSAPAEAREGFYRSFNTHFNTMIMSHEMFPGHYLQYKVAVSEAPMVRALFPNGSYVEGWGSFAEELMLDAGWAGNAPLTRLAHLRKRLENATRAYVSVKVNTAGWGEAQVLDFARDEGMLAPQFAENLWQRVVNSPLQITDYMTGYLHFRRLYAEHRERAGAADPKPWVDRVLRAGPLPMSLLTRELQDTAQPR
jgi:uncharacterized protein (DUF885 family)